MPGAHPQKNIENKKASHIDSRFGAIALSKAEEFFFPQGIVGFPSEKQYVLTRVPGYHDRQDFSLLQCITNTDVAFIIMSLGDSADDSVVHSSDIKPYIQSLGLEEKTIQLYAIVSLGAKSNPSEITINLRAPLLFDMNEQKGWQIILDNHSYEIAHKLELNP